MRASKVVQRMGLLLALAVTLLAFQGCANAVTYAQHRAEDFAEMVDVGFTITKTPQIGLYWNSLSFGPGGYSNIDGWFAGWGGGKFGVQRHYNKCYGFLYLYEEIGWGDFDKNDPRTLYVQHNGIPGILMPPYVSNPAYIPACVHFFPHLGYVGFVWNARWTEIVDFALGWTTLDIAGDDGYRFGTWPGTPRTQL
jgi:hypothetical protein